MQSVERLKLLLVLTVCDIAASGLASGTAGRGSCCARSTRPVLLTGGFPEVSRAMRTGCPRKAGRGARRLAGEGAQALCRLHYENYLLAVDLADQLRHAEFIREADAANKKLATMVKTISSRR